MLSGLVPKTDFIVDVTKMYTKTEVPTPEILIIFNLKSVTPNRGDPDFRGDPEICFRNESR